MNPIFISIVIAILGISLTIWGAICWSNWHIKRLMKRFDERRNLKRGQD